jgi:hypothetical protein
MSVVAFVVAFVVVFLAYSGCVLLLGGSSDQYVLGENTVRVTEANLDHYRFFCR